MPAASKKWAYGALVVATIAIVGGYPWLGSESLDLSTLSDHNSPTYRILWELRLPRLWLTLLAGGVLAFLGGTYQILFHNPLAEPFLLGISSAVTLGIVAAEVFFHIPPQSTWSAALGMVGALIVTLFLLSLSLSQASQATERLVLFGLGINFVLSSMLFLILSYAYQHMGGGSQRWLFGHIPWVSGSEVMWLTIFCIPFITGIFILARGLDALAMGDAVARTLGFSPQVVRASILVLSCLLLSGVVFFTGGIGFVGLVIPHVVRLVFRPGSTRTLIGVSLILGGLFLASADIISRLLLPPFEFPIGIITTIVGGPLFLFLLWVRR